MEQLYIDGKWVDPTDGGSFATYDPATGAVIWVNDSQPAPTESMWGGYKQSGIGRELGPWASRPTSRRSRST